MLINNHKLWAVLAGSFERRGINNILPLLFIVLITVIRIDNTALQTRNQMA